MKINTRIHTYTHQRTTTLTQTYTDNSHDIKRIQINHNYHSISGGRFSEALLTLQKPSIANLVWLKLSCINLREWFDRKNSNGIFLESILCPLNLHFQVYAFVFLKTHTINEAEKRTIVFFPVKITDHLRYFLGKFAL